MHVPLRTDDNTSDGRSFKRTKTQPRTFRLSTFWDAHVIIDKTIKKPLHGTYGTVDFGTIKETGVRIAIKFSRHNQAIYTSTFDTEKRVACVLQNSPYVVKTLGVMASFERPAGLVMFRYDRTMCEFLSGATRVTDEAAAHTYVLHLVLMLSNVASGLSVVHAHGILHNDLHSGNVLLHGQDEAVLADFGRATFVSDGENNIVNAAPWLAENKGRETKLSRASDVFSLGALVWEALGDRRSIHMALSEHFADTKHSSVFDLGVGGSSGVVLRMLKNVVLMCTMPDPTMRPAVEEIEHQLQKVVSLVSSGTD